MYNPVDAEAAQRAMQFSCGWFANPIFGTGDYPEVMKTQVAMKSQEQQLNQSRLPEFTTEEIFLLKGACFKDQKCVDILNSFPLF